MGLPKTCLFIHIFESVCFLLSIHRRFHLVDSLFSSKKNVALGKSIQFDDIPLMKNMEHLISEMHFIGSWMELVGNSHTTTQQQQQKNNSDVTMKNDNNNSNSNKTERISSFQSPITHTTKRFSVNDSVSVHFRAVVDAHRNLSAFFHLILPK